MRADQRGCDCLDGGETTDRTARLGVCAQTTQVARGKLRRLVLDGDTNNTSRTALRASSRMPAFGAGARRSSSTAVASCKTQSAPQPWSGRTRKAMPCPWAAGHRASRMGVSQSRRSRANAWTSLPAVG